MSLINLDVDKLFEQHNINEIEAVNRKIQYEVEKKKEELRTMVKFQFSIYAILIQQFFNYLKSFRSVSGIEI